MTTGTHLDDERLRALAAGGLAADEARAVEAHLAGCVACRARADVAKGKARAAAAADTLPVGSASIPPTLPAGSAAVSPTLPAPATPDASPFPAAERAPHAEPAVPLARGTAIERYLVTDRLGSGGMGVVYAAYDPELHRKVAIKLLHAEVAGLGDTSGARARLEREAQAMARVSHPNVISVFDVGEFQHQVFVAMELVEGGSLRDWLGREPRSWRQVVDVFVLAGRGLAAAHAADLVHRDFKPDNVLVGADGRVRVTDFGLARAGEADDPRPGGPSARIRAPRSTGPLSTPLTQTGALMGTPAYMAPEQYGGAATDARTDQFSFCVALYEGLYGERPFGDLPFAELLEAVTGGRVRAAPAGARVPAWVRRALLRGLATRPEDRWPTMAALLHQLGRDPARRQRRIALAAAGALAVGGVIMSLALRAPTVVREIGRASCRERV